MRRGILAVEAEGGSGIHTGQIQKDGTCMIADEILYEHFWDGEQQAADELVRRHGDILLLFINGYLRDIHEAEDLMIEAFALMFSKKRPVSGDGSFRAYLYKTARNLAGRAVKGRRFFIGFDELPFEIQSDALADTKLFEDERNRQLYDAMDKLKPEYQEALYLVYFEDMSYRDAARVMKRSESQITNMIHRGKQSLKKHLDRDGFEF